MLELERLGAAVSPDAPLLSGGVAVEDFGPELLAAVAGRRSPGRSLGEGSPIHGEHRPAHVGRIIRGQENCRAPDVLRCAQPTQRELPAFTLPSSSATGGVDEALSPRHVVAGLHVYVLPGIASRTTGLPRSPHQPGSGKESEANRCHALRHQGPPHDSP